MRRMGGKRGENILTESIVFIILNIVFLLILLAFVMRSGNGKVVLEQNLAKKIALTIDAAQPGMRIFLELSESEKKIAEADKIPWKDIIRIGGNVVHIKLYSQGGSEYSFFNNADVNIFEEGGGKYVLVVE